ncbi:hypothetical protein FG386_001206 [Cryptosporidium ryanae]|uniref:uncharacterized protein n=1 Tax=Cryptosporidium ryanae TaxID=515981 RepID=UPI00351A7F92|nr:hypothetical protein FG386_001206 [Cryptosporidium ryanae]
MGNAMDKAGDGMSQGRRNAENKDGLHKTHNQSENGHKTSKGGKRRGSGREKDKGAPKELKNEINGGARSGAGGLDNSKNASKHKGTKRDADRKFDAIKESRDYDAKETKVEHDISLKDRISTTRRCRLNIPPYSRVPEPEYKIKLLVEETYEGPFRLLLRKNPCMLELASIDGLTLRSIKKSDILFIQTLGSEILKLFIKSEIDGEGGNSNDAKKSNVEIMMIVFKFTNQKDLESFEFFFPFMYGIILHSDKVKIPVADYIEFSDYIIGSNKNILKRMDEYKELSKNNGRCLDYEDESENEIDDNKLSNLYEEKMVQRERDFFTRKDLKINYVDDSFLGQEASGSANGGSDSLSTESMDAKNDSYEKKKEKYSKLFPISISGQSESGEIITFKDISHIGSKYKAEVIEWRLSTNIGGSDCLFSELPISVSKTFQINDDHVSFQTTKH